MLIKIAFHPVCGRHTVVSCMLGWKKHVRFGALKRDQRRGRPGPLPHPPVVRGAPSDLSGRNPGAAGGRGTPIGDPDRATPSANISTTNGGPLRGGKRDVHER